MPRPARVPDELAHAPFRGSVAVQRLLVTRRQLRSAVWRRMFRDVYVLRELPDSAALRAQAAALLVDRRCVVTGRCAAWLHGVDVRLPVDHHRIEASWPSATHPPRRRTGLRPREAPLPAGEVTSVHGVAVTTPVRTAYDLARQPDLVEAVVGVDAMLHAELVSAAELAAFAEAHPRQRRVRQVGAVLAIADPGAESPPESRLRVHVLRHGLPRPRANVDVYDAAGRWLARGDLVWERERVIAEYEGATHKSSIVADVARVRRLEAAGWKVLRCTSVDLHEGREAFLSELAVALATPRLAA